MRQARAGHDTCGQRVTPRCRWAGGLAGQRGDAPSEARGADGSRACRHPPAHTATRHHWCGGRRRDRGHGRASRRRAVRSSRRGRLTGGSPPTGTHSDQAPQVWRAPEDPWAWLRCPWAGAGPGRTTSRRAERSSRRGRIAGGSPPTGTHSDQAPQVWRAPEGPEGTGGLRDRPLRAAGSRVAISRAAGPNGARNTRGATSNTSRKAAAHGHTKQPGPAGRAKRPAQQHTTRRPERQRRHKKHSTGARARRPAPLDATTQTRVLRSTCVPCRSARAARRSR